MWKIFNNCNEILNKDVEVKDVLEKPLRKSIIIKIFEKILGEVQNIDL